MSAPDQHPDNSTKHEPADYVKGDAFEEKVLAAELEHIRQQFPDVDKTRLFGLAFSGGGIRSAVFSLGVMQALAEIGWLKRFHYLSTVSGGGYIGASLTWLLHKGWKLKDDSETRFDTGDAFPYRRDVSSQANDTHSCTLTRHLRQHAEYLKPGGGISTGSLLAVLLRGSLLSLLVYIPPLLLLLSLAVSFGLFGGVSALHTGMIDISASTNSGDIALYQMLQHLNFVGDITRWHIQVAGNSYMVALNPLLVAALALLLLFAMSAVYYGFKTTAQISGRQTYDLRRFYEIKSAVALKVILVLLLLGSLPVVAGLLGQMQERIAAAITGSGVIASVLAILKGSSKDKGKLPIGLIASLALGLLVYGLLLLLFVQAVSAQGSLICWLLLTLLVALSVALGYKVNINYISIHRYYRDRLMELFLPDVEGVLASEHAQAAYAANGSGVGKMCDYKAGAKGPYHLLNCNMLTIDSQQPKLKARGGDSFIFSPLYCGSEATGWRNSRQYMNGGMNLATAMAVAGAAADPHGAPGGEGLTRNPSLSFLMALLNVRLGYWAPHPQRTDYATPNGFGQGWRELTGSGMDETADFVHLADGGHFENLALYELIRRKVKTIVMCDGAADAEFTFVDFANLVEKVRVDFGVEIKVQGHSSFKIDGKQAHSLLAMCPKPNKVHPHGVDLADSGFVTATIHYGNGTDPGMLIYIKTTLIGGLPDDIYAYKRGHKEFPDESTADQFFDEKQFEAYRELGYQLGKSLDNDKNIRALFNPNYS